MSEESLVLQKNMEDFLALLKKQAVGGNYITDYPNQLAQIEVDAILTLCKVCMDQQCQIDELKRRLDYLTNQNYS